MRNRTIVACLSSLTLGLGGLAALAAPVSAAATPAAPVPTAESALRAASSGPVKIVRGTDKVVHFIGTVAGKPVRRPASVTAGSTPDAIARAHLARYGSLLGLTDPARQLRTERVTAAAGGTQIARYAQVMNRLPVLGGELSVSLDKAGNLLSINGETSRSTTSTSFALPVASAARIAISSAAKANHVKASRLSATAPQELMYDGSLVGPTKMTGARSVWRVEVSDGADVRQLVLVDGATGAVALSFNQVADIKTRHICDLANVPDDDYTCVPGNYVRNEGGPTSPVADVEAAYANSGATYDFYNTQFGRDGIDNAGMPLISSVRVCPSSGCPFDNAFWDGTQMVYGEGFAGADDVVAHELTHGVTERTSGLLYYYQSGAINESMSDIFGELVDQANVTASDNASVKWQLGEDLPGGAVRDMSSPGVHGQPDKTSSSLWNSDWSDSGGVHENSGVGNKAAYLMTDGDDFNGITVTGIGNTKVAAIYYQAELTMTSGSDYPDLSNILQQSCTTLVGTKGITAADCTQVTNAVNAVEMSSQPVNDPPLPAASPTCDGTAVTRFADDFSGSLAKWTVSAPGKWAIDHSYQKSASSGGELYGPDFNSTSDASIATSTAFVVPYAKETYFRFDHAYSFDWFGPDPNFPEDPNTYYDGGFVEVSINNGASWTTISVASNGYNSKLEAPLSRSAFSGDSTDWITSQANLSAYAGRSVKLRFRIVTDGVGAASTAYGWWIDNVRAYSCAPHPKADYTGDGAGDFATWHPATGTWYVSGLPNQNFGQSGDIPVPGDYTADGKSDLAVYRPSAGQWHIQGLLTVNYGNSTDKPVAADYNGDGKADVAIWRPSNGTWNVRGVAGAVAYGVAGDIPVPGDYNGDGKADFAVWRPSTGQWFVKGMPTVTWGVSGDKVAVADYTGDGKTDVAVWRPSNKTWYVRGQSAVAFGQAGDAPTPSDKYGDGTASFMIWRNSLPGFALSNLPSPSNWGFTGDTPLYG